MGPIAFFATTMMLEGYIIADKNGRSEPSKEDWDAAAVVARRETDRREADMRKYLDAYATFLCASARPKRRRWWLFALPLTLLPLTARADGCVYQGVNGMPYWTTNCPASVAEGEGAIRQAKPALKPRLKPAADRDPGTLTAARPTPVCDDGDRLLEFLVRTNKGEEPVPSWNLCAVVPAGTKAKVVAIGGGTVTVAGTRDGVPFRGESPPSFWK